MRKLYIGLVSMSVFLIATWYLYHRSSENPTRSYPLEETHIEVKVKEAPLLEFVELPEVPESIITREKRVYITPTDQVVEKKCSSFVLVGNEKTCLGSSSDSDVSSADAGIKDKVMISDDFLERYPDEGLVEDDFFWEPTPPPEVAESRDDIFPSDDEEGVFDFVH